MMWMECASVTLGWAAWARETKVIQPTLLWRCRCQRASQGDLILSVCQCCIDKAVLYRMALP